MSDWRNEKHRATDNLNRFGLFKSYPLLARLLIFIVLPCLVFIVSLTVYLYRSVPDKAGQIIVSNVENPVSIFRDQQGVVHIEGKDDNDVFFALGFAHAQDRLWQMELQRRLAGGRLSEIFGKLEISQDAWLRTLGLYTAAQQSWALLSGDAKDSLTSYKNGVNAWLETKPVLPVEFAILGIKPELWSEIDSLAWIKLFALDLSNNMWKEGANYIAGQVLNETQMMSLLKRYPQDSITTISKTELKSSAALFQFSALQKTLEMRLKLGGAYVGSNAWVISGQYTDNGQAILANDPHLALQMPSLWYVANLKGDKLNASGMTLVGLPLVIFGRNQDIAWGGTNMMADVQDLYFEQVNSQDPKLYQYGDEWKAFESRTEVINVRADFPSALMPEIKPVEVLLRKTVHGPVISDIHGFFDQVVALKWTALNKDDVSYEGFFRLNYAHDWNSFRQALKYCTAPALNMVYADKNNNIGYQAVGKIPIRNHGNGSTPVPGWKREYAWKGFIPYEELPSVYNPDKGYIVSANNKIINSEYPYFISNDWAEPARANRIEQLIQEKVSGKALLSIDDMKNIQSDTLDLSANKLLELLKGVSSRTKRQSEALKYIGNWQGDMSADSQAAAIFFVWVKHLRKELYMDELEGYWNKPEQKNSLNNIVYAATYDQVYLALSKPELGWCDKVSSKAVETCESIISDSLEKALQELEKFKGNNMQEWLWGSLHTTVYAHLPFSYVNLLDLLFERRLPGGGSPNSINVAGASFSESEGYLKNFGAGFRQIIQPGLFPISHHYMNSTGQSGNILSEYYDNMVIPFANFDYFSLQGNIAANKNSLLIIKPVTKSELSNDASKI